MMRYLIVRLLIVFTLLANLSWAADVYMSNPETDHTTLVTASADHQGECPPGIDCHHCCHASAHLLTLPGAGISIYFATGQRLNVTEAATLSSFISAPPYQPPRV